ncbi:helix-turn-helix domain-containing protein [Shewanella eurypsychrophilus]|uniref:Helix-turn-helix domain-containing protein n=1 Tax=Shewanella eurypsychrophilus TaxID=2593656 RepID=A0ABX6VAV8_9GAMM|nr:MULTISPECIES: helix-turn-helix domain-containing protein [Shewanella]QFU24616.1 helix-turn-helix domain-containing protein [Shewanella sp. YLB-09]QPG59813.1 helix-turn-helix domain-containing protein [Shewanella eurypsychrophilus]
MPKEFKPTQHSMVSVLLRETDKGEFRKRKLDLSKELGLSYPTYMKLVEDKTDLTIPVLWAWCDLLDLSPSDIYVQAKIDSALDADVKEGIWPIEMLSVMPKDVESAFMDLMLAVSKGFKSFDNDKLAGAHLLKRDSAYSSDEAKHNQMSDMANYLKKNKSD